MTKSRTLKIQAVAAITAMLLVSFMVVRTSSAAFTDEVTSGESSVAAGTLLFDGNTDVSDVIDVENILPGFTETLCYEVTYAGSAVPNDLALQASIDGTDGTSGLSGLTGVVADDGLQDHLTMEVHMGDVDETCTSLLDGDVLDGLLAEGTAYAEASSGTLANFTTVDLDGLTSGTVTGWDPDPDTGTDMTRAFVVVLDLASGVGNSAQGDSASVTFTWTVQ